jgi:hypothetical protein
MTVASFAVHVNASCNTGWAHRFDFTSTAMRNGRWERASLNAPSNYLAPGGCSAWDGRRGRVWWLASLTSLPGHIRYLEVASKQQMQIDFARGAAAAPPLDFDSATLRHDPLRDVLLLSGTLRRELVLACLHCERPEAGWFVPTLSQRVPVQANASAGFDYVSELDAFVLLSASDSHAVYSLRAQGEADSAWAVQRLPLGPLELPTARVVGKRWSYCQAVGCFVWMASSTSPVVAYRPAR